MNGFINANVYVEGKGIIKTNLGIENGKIAYIGENQNVITKCYPYNADQVIVAGFIDQHIHGAGGFDAMDGNEKALRGIANSVAKEGTTTFLATTMTQSEENILKAVSAVREYKAQKYTDGAEILGIHLEGPFISENHVGAQPIEYLTKPCIEVFDKYNKESGNNIKIVSLAPEVEGASELITHLVKNGVIASAGHTDAGYDNIKKAVELGLTNITHTYNAQKALHHREIGTVGSAMLFDQVNCEAICDLIHLSAPAIKLLIKNKPKDKFTLITDSMRAKHLPDGESELGGQKVIVKNGQARLVNGALAGSTLKMNDAVKNLVLSCGVPFLNAIDYATINPAKNLKIDNRKGSITIGKDADLTVLDGEFNVCLTIRNGNVIYRNN